MILLCLSGCSEDARFINRSLGDASLDADAVIGSCAVGDELQAGSASNLTCVAPRAQLLVEPSEASLMVGESLPLKAYLLSASGKRVDVTTDTTWAIDDSKRLELRAGAIVKALEPGDAKVDASYLNASASAVVSIKTPAPVPEPSVGLTVAGVTERVTLAEGLASEVVWTSKDVASCSLLVGDLEIERKLMGASVVKFSQSTTVAFRCRTLTGETVQETVAVTVTRPKVWITGSESLKIITAKRGTPVVVTWTSADAKSCDIRDGSRVVASALSGSMIVTADRSRKIEALCDDTAGNKTDDFIAIAVEFESRLVFAPGHYEQIPGTSVQRPVSIVFALDVTGSMQGQIETVKSGVRDFVSQLVSRGFHPRLGVIPFRDKVPYPGNNGDVSEGRLELTDDVNRVKDFVQTLRALGGGDANEAALGAIKAAVHALRDGDDRPDAVKIVMVVTDQPGHHGASTKDCTLGPLTNDLGLLTDAQQRNFKLFYSSPSTGYGCSGFASGQAQMAKILESVFLAEPLLANRGGLIPWPFAATNLIYDVVNMLVKTAPPIDLACVNDTVDVTLDGAPYLSRVMADRGASFRALEESKTVFIAQTMTETDHLGFEAGDGMMTASRCCVSKAAAKVGDFGTCLKRWGPQTIGFSLED
jgi:hypothetical protein